MKISSAAGLPPPAPLELLEPRLRALCDTYFQAGKVPGASVAVVMGDSRYHHAHGVKSVRSDERVTIETGFNIGSCSKAFVSTAVAALVSAGLANWDAPISRWVPEFQLYDPALTTQISLRDVCGNRLGLPRSGFVEYGFLPSIPVERILRGLRHTPPIHPLRSRFSYVNPGHTAAALAVGRITGLGFLETVRQRVLEPLGMTGATGGIAARATQANQAGWHVRDGDVVVPLEPLFTDNCLGSGGMVVSGHEALQWLRLHLNGGLVDGRQVIGREALLETHRPQVVATPGKDITSLFYPGAHMGAYAMGWAVSDFEGHPLVCHSGSDAGVTAMTMLLPRSGIGIAVYANAFSGVTVPLVYALAATLLGMPPRDWLAYFKAAGQALAPAAIAPADSETQAARALADYTGTFVNPADGPLRIELDGTGLLGDMPDGDRVHFRLTALGEHQFSVTFTELPTRLVMLGFKLEFEILDGQISAAVMQDSGGVKRVFKRQTHDKAETISAT
jgi:CubicO group peptidase (beta-lactamase class C family)